LSSQVQSPLLFSVATTVTGPSPFPIGGLQMTQRKNQFCLIWFVVLGIVLWFGTERARADVTGTILGNVTDPSGAAVPGATVTLSHPDTGLTRQTATDSIGFYQFLAVPVGENYIVEVELKGFQKSTQSGIKLLVNQKYRDD